jgi:hypothetical protein
MSTPSINAAVDPETVIVIPKTAPAVPYVFGGAILLIIDTMFPVHTSANKVSKNRQDIDIQKLI